MKKVLLALATAGVCFSASAGWVPAGVTTGGAVGNIAVEDQKDASACPVVFFEQIVGGVSTQYAFPLSTPAANAWLAQLNTAKLKGSTVDVFLNEPADSTTFIDPRGRSYTKLRARGISLH